MNRNFERGNISIMTKRTLLRSAAIVLAFLFLTAAVAGCKPKEGTNVTDVEVIDESPSPAPTESIELPDGVIDPTPRRLYACALRDRAAAQPRRRARP